MPPFDVFTRWRPLLPTKTETESQTLEINRVHTNQSQTRYSTSLMPPPSSRDRPWRSDAIFTRIFEGTDNNKTVFDAVVSPILPRVLKGQTCNFLAYGHSGSGKSHTIIGYDFEHPNEFGLCLAAAREISEELERANGELPRGSEDVLGIGLRMYELRGNMAFDLLNEHCRCHIREGYDGQTYIRGETEVMDDGRVRVRPIMTRACWSLDELRSGLVAGLERRATGPSTIHDQSSRTHAVLEIEIITRALLEARDAVVERQSELVPVAKRATDIYLEENMKGFVRTEDGKFVPNPEYQIDQARIDEAEAKKAEFECYVQKAEEHVDIVFKASQHPCLGGKLIFVDLAGSEYYHDKSISASASRANPTPQEQREGRQINTDLLALKEVIRARALKQSRIPYRSSPLTMVLRGHFEPSTTTASYTAMILTASPESTQFAATMNTLKYGNLVGVACGDKARSSSSRK
ncbi:P-loop containing nucleoside triphosphate hydrolase protein [Aspergillus granulosus]|uniref:Kinesin-like protein n=1 Tax=Aspergillus granulosus TaxID=176169 RepID=A0ABR4GUH3_9EURO